MKVFIVFICLCLVSVAYSQILRPGNTPEESGAPIYEEITVESVLTVRSKGSRTGKSSTGVNASESADGVNVSRRTRSAELRQEPAEDVLLGDEVLVPIYKRALHPKFTLS